MLEILIFLITAILGFICLAVILGKSKYQNKIVVNKYLSVIIAQQAFRFSIYAFSKLYPQLKIDSMNNFIEVSYVLILPCYVLYFSNMSKRVKSKDINPIHFILPFILLVISIVKSYVNPSHVILIKEIFLVLIVSTILFYTYLGFSTLIKDIWTRNSEIKAIQRQNQLIKHWSIFLYVSFVANGIIRIFTGFFLNNDHIYNTNYIWITALIYLTLFIKIILSPEILYGYDFLNKSIDEVTEKITLNTVWKINGTVTEINSEKDKKIEEKLNGLLANYIHKIEELSFNSDVFRDPKLGFEEISSMLKIPVSHINYIFKFHCLESFTDYKKIVRIHDATKLIEKGYLNDKTIESLSEKVGFSSYITFHLAFKSITGLSTQEYLKRLV